MGQDGRKPEQHRRRFRDIFKRSDNISHRNDHSQKKSGQSNQSKPTEEPEQQGQPQTPLAPPTAKEGNIPATPAPTIIDELWGRAFQQLAPELQKKLRARGMDEKRTVAMKDQLGAFKAETERLQEASKGRDWKLSVKGQEIPVRDLTVRIVGWAIKLGNVAMPFAEATCPAAAVWGVVTLFLQVWYPPYLRGLNTGRANAC